MLADGTVQIDLALDSEANQRSGGQHLGCGTEAEQHLRPHRLCCFDIGDTESLYE